MAKKETKTLYHSELTEMGPVQVRVMSDPLQSKFKKDQVYVDVFVQGRDRSYICENEDCIQTFEGKKGQTFYIIAEGSRDEATVSYVGERAEDGTAEEPARAGRATPKPEPTRASSPPAAQPVHQAAAPHQSQPARKQLSPDEVKLDTFKRAKVAANKIVNLWLTSYAAAEFARDQVREQFGQEVSESQFQSLVSTIQIQMMRDGFHHQFPGGIVIVHQAAKPVQPVSQPVPAPPPPVAARSQNQDATETEDDIPF